MNLVLNNTNTNSSVFDDPVESEQLLQFTQYTRSHKGGRIVYQRYFAVSSGKSKVESWVKSFLSEEKEELYLRALRNLYRKLDFLELNQLLEMGDISDEEYDEELIKNEDKYLIPAPSGIPTAQQIIQIADIIKRLGKEKKITVDEVSELFSIEMDKAMEILNK